MSRTGQIISHFPDFFRSGESENLFYQYIGVFASMIDDAEEELLRVMRTHWVNTADNEGSKGFDATEKGDLDKILALYLESLGGTALVKQGKRRSGADGKADDDLYRTRILGLIQVLKNGASTRAGIIDIVAANLGMLSDLPYAPQAHDSINIIEFLPETINNSPIPVPVALYENISVNNLSELPAITEFRLEFLRTLPIPLINPRIRNVLTGDSVQYTGTVTPGDTLYFLSDRTGLFRGQPFLPDGGFTLPPGPSDLQLEAEVGVPQGNFNTAFFDYAQFDFPTIREVGVFDAGRFGESIFTYTAAVANIEVRQERLFPGSFMVVIPWDIPGFSANITITAHTLGRLAGFGLPQALLDTLANPPKPNASLLDKVFETREEFFAALGPVVESHVAIELNRQNISQLHRFGVPGALISKALSLLAPDTGTAIFEHVPDFFSAIGAVSDSQKKPLYAAMGVIAKVGSSLDLLLRECLFTDKYARFNISPRGQIKAIVDRVKAAGVYAVIAFEKRFWEDQQLGESFGIGMHWIPEYQDMLESNFDIVSLQMPDPGGLKHDMSDMFTTSGVFDYTHFESLNSFA